MVYTIVPQTVEKRPREMMLRREFADAVGYLNQTYPEDKRLCFIHWDFHKFAKGSIEMMFQYYTFYTIR